MQGGIHNTFAAQGGILVKTCKASLCSNEVKVIGGCCIGSVRNRESMLQGEYGNDLSRHLPYSIAYLV